MFNQKFNNHIATLMQANGQPLNDKRNGRATGLKNGKLKIIPLTLCN